MSLTLATLSVEGWDPITVHFNPSSLKITTTNQFDDAHPNQVSKPTAFKLDVELLFDTTATGTDVHRVTLPILGWATASAEGAKPHDDAGNDLKATGGNKSHLNLVTLTWGTLSYRGYIESHNETVDYWSSDGVPLRATVQLSLKGTTKRFLAGSLSDRKAYPDNPAPSLPDVVLTSTALEQGRFDKVAAEAGDTSTGRGLAGLNGVENMRGTAAPPAVQATSGPPAASGPGAGAAASAGAGAGAAFVAGAGAQLQAAAGFKVAGGVSAGASAGFGAGAAAGLSAGAGLGASVGVGMAAGAGAGASAGAGFGAAAGAAFGASAGVGSDAAAAAGFGAGSLGASASAGIGFGASADLGGGGFGVTTSTSVTRFDGVTTTSTVTGFDGRTVTDRSTTVTSGASPFGSLSAGVPASAGAFAGLGLSRTTLPAGAFDPDRLLPPPAPFHGSTTSYDVSGRAVSRDGQVAASYAAYAGVTVW